MLTTIEVFCLLKCLKQAILKTVLTTIKQYICICVPYLFTNLQYKQERNQESIIIKEFNIFKSCIIKGELLI